MANFQNVAHDSFFNDLMKFFLLQALIHNALQSFSIFPKYILQ